MCFSNMCMYVYIYIYISYLWYASKPIALYSCIDINSAKYRAIYMYKDLQKDMERGKTIYKKNMESEKKM